MKGIFLGLVCYIAGMVIGFFVVLDSNPLTEILGTTYSELSSMKKECESTIPRNQHCVASILFLPTASED